MKARPAFQFYPSDWLREPGLRSCSPAARGIWIDMLCFMHEAEPYGHLRLNGHDIELHALTRMIGIPKRELQKHLDELEAAGVFSRTETGTIYSRRMVRDEELRNTRGECGQLSAKNPAVPRKKGGEKDTFQPSLPPSLQGSPSSSSSSSSSASSSSSSSSSSSASSSKKREEMPPEVAMEFEAFWNLAPPRNGKLLGELEASQKFLRLSAEDRPRVLIAVKHYAESTQVKDGIGIMDPHRFLQNSNGAEPWREWIEPETKAVAPQRKCARNLTSGPCEEYAMTGSHYCPEHKEKIATLQRTRMSAVK